MTRQRPVQPTVRVRAAPATEPPFDDEVPPELWGQLALDWTVPARSDPAIGSTLPPVVTGPSPEARTAVRRFLHVLIEALNGYRPPTHLRQLCRPVAAPAIIAHTRAAQHRIAVDRRARPSAAPDGRSAARVAAAAARHGRRPDPVAVLKLSLCAPTAVAVEGTVLLVTGTRTWALALRLEHDATGWATTVATLLQPTALTRTGEPSRSETSNGR